MKYRSKIKVEIIKKPDGNNPEGSDWVKVNFVDGFNQGWIPGLPELAEIIRPIAKIEEVKYREGKGAEYVRQFFMDVCLTDVPIEELYDKYSFKPRENRGNYPMQASF